MSSRSSSSSKFFAALIMLPLIIVAGLVAFNLYRGNGLEDEANLLAATLDRALDRDVATARAGLAILPLSNDSGDEALEYLGTGLAEDLRHQLVNVKGIRLIGAESSGNVAGQPLSRESIARLLGVRYLLHGSVTGEASDLNIELALIDANSAVGSSWEERWHSPASGLANTTRAIAARVLETVLPGNALSQPGTPGARRDPSGAALNDYLRGKYLIDRYNSADVLTGIEYMERAIAADPLFERAHWGKIAGHQRMTWIDAQAADDHNGHVSTAVEAWLAQGVEAPLTYRLHALRASQENRYVEADAAFRRAVALAPQQYAYDRGYMVDLCIAGYLQRCLEQAIGLARADPVSAAAHTGLANVYRLMGERDRMLEHAALSTRFGGDLGEFYVALDLLNQQRWDEGASKLSAALNNVGVSSDWVRPWTDAQADPGLADEAVARMSEVDEASADWLDLLYSELVAIDRIDLAYETAYTLIEDGFETWNLYVWEQGMRRFRDDPRFAGLMGLAGMLELWQTLGPPDVCSGPEPEPFCEQIYAETPQ